MKPPYHSKVVREGINDATKKILWPSGRPESAEGLSNTSAPTSQVILHYWLLVVENPRDTTIFRLELKAAH